MFLSTYNHLSTLSFNSEWGKTENSDLKPLTGFKLSLEEKIKYDEITKVIKSNSNNKSSVFSFPYGTPYNLLANKFNIAGFVPIIFYDVCSDNYAELQANYLNDNKPDIFIWINIPYCLNVHEKIFRQGNICKQRKIIEWFERVKDTNYELMTSIECFGF